MNVVKYILLAWLSLFGVSANAQFYLWRDGDVVYSIEDGHPDSITFSVPEKYPQKNFLFSVADGRRVHFSPGNLQECDMYFEWRFAEHQYDIIGLDNKYVEYSADIWIDLFSWGTCGWDVGFEPTSTSTDYRDFLVGGSWNNSLVGDNVGADWGTHNRVSNAWTDTGWRTLTSDEWAYLLTARENAVDLFGLATIGDVKGLVLLPDGWILPQELSFVPSVRQKLTLYVGQYEDVAVDLDKTYDKQLAYETGRFLDDDMVTDNYSDNVYTIEQWTKMEKNGAIFLPVGGRRWGTSIRNYPSNPWGVYWSSTTGTQEREGNVHALSFFMSGVTPRQQTSRVWGCSVRLVIDE